MKIFDKDKLYIVVYLAIGTIDNSGIEKYISDFDNTVRFFILPTREPNNRIEFYNGEMLKKLESDTIETLINNLKINIKNAL